MNQETNQGSHTQHNGGKPPRKNFTWLLLVIIGILLGFNIYLFTRNNKVADENTFLINENTDLTAAKDTLQGQYDAALARLDELVGKNAEMDSMINERDGEIGKLKKEIRTLLSKRNATVSDLKKAQSLIASLNKKVKNYQDRITELEAENSQLSEANTNLTSQRDSVGREAAELKKLGSVLHVSNIKMEPINLKRGGTKEVETSKAKRVDILRIVFDIDENRVAEDGMRDIYVVIKGPDGQLLSNAAYGSGVTTDADGASLNYTLVKQVSLTKNQPVTNVTVDWKQESDYKKGTYSITFYNEGYKIGSGSTTMR